MQFTVESNNALYSPPLSVFILFLAEKQGLGQQIPWNALSPQYSSVSFFLILVSDHRRVTALSPHCPRLRDSIPGIILIAPIMNLSDHWRWNPVSSPSCCSSVFAPCFYPCLSVQHHIFTWENVCNAGWDTVAQESAEPSRAETACSAPRGRNWSTVCSSRLTDRGQILFSRCTTPGPGWMWRDVNTFYMTKYNVSEKVCRWQLLLGSAWIPRNKAAPRNSRISSQEKAETLLLPTGFWGHESFTQLSFKSLLQKLLAGLLQRIAPLNKRRTCHLWTFWGVIFGNIKSV